MLGRVDRVGARRDRHVSGFPPAQLRRILAAARRRQFLPDIRRRYARLMAFLDELRSLTRELDARPARSALGDPHERPHCRSLISAEVRCDLR